MRRDKEIFAIPMWLNGRAYLKLASDYRDVCNPANGEILRKAPLFGSVEVGESLDSAGRGLAAWLALGESGRERLLASLGDALYDLRAHFSRLMSEETGKDEESASRAVIELVSCLRRPQAAGVAGVAGVVAVIADSRAPQHAGMQVVSALAVGAVVVICPSPESPSALFALAELSGRCGFPAGVINVMCLSDEGGAFLRGIDGITVLD